MKTEIYISVKDLIKECIRKIWIIIVAMVVFGILLAGFRYAKDKKNIANTTVAESTEKVDVEKIVDDLERDDYNQVMTYVDLTNYRDQNRLYTADAKLMKINPYKVDTVLLQYYVNAEDENTRKDMAAAYLSYISGGSLAADVVENNDLEDSSSDIQELIQCDATGLTTGTAFYTENTNTINMYVYGVDEQDAKDIASYVKESMDAYSQKLSAVAPHTLTLFEEQYSVTCATKLVSLKNDRFGNLMTYNDRTTSYEGLLSDKQKESAQKIVSAQKENDELEDSNETGKTAKKDETPKASISKKYLVVGAFLGLVLAVVIIVLRYMFDPTIKTSKDLQMFYGTNFIGDVAQADGALLAASKIINMCSNRQIKKVLIAGKMATENEAAIKEVVDAVEKKGIVADIIGDILTDADAVQTLEAKSNVVLVEAVRKSKYEDFNQEKALCESLDAQLLGYIAITK
ncbi:MAG: hypothetical protein PUB68_07580 [Lachnospiraceae bacterium]|nr:hypothetical protein [Lachnospiraceae bacterium]MDY6156544.1 hypothetical protein [Agathobacter sp.]